MLANSKIARQIESKAFNPEYVFTSETEDFSLGEVAAPIVAFGSFEDGTVERDLVEYFFGKSIPAVSTILLRGPPRILFPAMTIHLVLMVCCDANRRSQ